MSELTRAQKAAATTRARRERREAEEAAARNDRKRAVEICREIRDNPDSSDADKLRALVVLAQYTGRPA